MKEIYRKQLKNEGYDKDSEMYKGIERVFNTSCKAMQRERAEIKECGVKLNRLSAFTNAEGEYLDVFPVDNDLEERILHAVELDALRICISQLPVDDQRLLYRVFSGDYGEMAVIAAEAGASYVSVYKRVRRLIRKLRIMMTDMGF